METSTAIRCLKCDAITTELVSYEICGHMTCVECRENVSDDFEPNVMMFRSHNPNCPVCQRNMLFSSNQRDKPFPPYFRRFDIIQNAVQMQMPVFCDQCSPEFLRAAGTNRCLDCQLNLCDECTCVHLQGADFGRPHRIFTMFELQDGNVFQDFRLVARDDQRFCFRHANLLFSHWCNCCQTALCRQCIRHHESHDVITLTRRLSEIDSYVLKKKAAVETFTKNFTKVCEKHERSKQLVCDHFGYLAASIRSAGDERKRKIDRDADRLLQQVEDIMKDYELKCSLVEDMIETEETAAHAWTKIMDIFQDGGGLADDKLMDFFQFLKANDDVLQKQTEGIREISESTPKLSAIRQCIFEENSETFKSGSENSIGWIKTPILMLVGEVAEEGGIWVLVGDRGRRASRHQKRVVLPHFLTMMPRDVMDYSTHGSAGGKAFNTIV